MKGYLDTLRPVEKRLVVVVGVVLFIVANAAFVFPHFSDLDLVKIRMLKARRTLDLYKAEIQQMPGYSNILAQLEKEGLAVPQEDQAAAFQTAYQVTANKCGVRLDNSGRVTTRTNQFFLELSLPIRVQAGEQQLVDFLYSLGSGDSLMRVRDMSLSPDAPRYQLAANLTLVASYQKKLPAKPAAKSAGSAASAAATPIAKRP